MPSVSPQVVILGQGNESRDVVEKLLLARGLSVAATDDPCAAATLAQAATTELLLVDLSRQALDAVPRWSRRRGDSEPKAPADAEGYALLRSVVRDPMVGHLPLMTLKNDAAAQRFGLLDVIAAPVDGERLRAKVARALNDVVLPPEPSLLEQEHDQALPLAFDVLPHAMRRALVVDPDARHRRWIRGLMAIHGFRVSSWSAPLASYRCVT